MMPIYCIKHFLKYNNNMCINLGIRNETRIIYWLRNLNLNMSSVADKKILFKENGLIFLRDVVYFSSQEKIKQFIFMNRD